MVSDCHLILQELRLQPASEWSPPAGVWTVVRVAEGFGYLLKAGVPRELETGDMFVTTDGPGVVVRASSLAALKLDFFLVHPEWLNGLLTVAEGHDLARSHRQAGERPICIRAVEPAACKFARLVVLPHREDLAVRMALLQLWSQTVAVVLPRSEPREPDADGRKLRERFRRLLSHLPHAELARQSLSTLAAQLHCSERHFSRLFREEYRVSFRARQTELRLQLAQELLLDSGTKIASVALQSGYRHIGLFNAMFKRQFGMTPTDWRKKWSDQSGPPGLPMFLIFLFQCQFSDILETAALFVSQM
jgi:AraC-like DNA-binding protein